eukprot:3577932-Pleurochrysis_carterae.AAC.1
MDRRQIIAAAHSSYKRSTQPQAQAPPQQSAAATPALDHSLHTRCEMRSVGLCNSAKLEKQATRAPKGGSQDEKKRMRETDGKKRSTERKGRWREKDEGDGWREKVEGDG